MSGYRNWRSALLPSCILLAGVGAACGGPEEAEFSVEGQGGRALPAVVETEAALTGEPLHPDFKRKLSDPAGYTGPMVQESICGATDDAQHVNNYNGTLGRTVTFVHARKYAVGALESSATASSSAKYCSGTLIGRDLFLTASHCVGTGITSHYVAFNYEQAPGSTTLNTQVHYAVTQVVEDGAANSIDYAILRLSGNPGAVFGWTRLYSGALGTGESLAIIQHPAGEAKQVEVGNLSSVSGNYMYYSELDTEGGSSGSGVLDAWGYLVGVHTNGGCTSSGGTNSGIRLQNIHGVSATVQGIVSAGQGDTGGGDVHVATSNGSGLTDRGWRWHDWFCVGSEVCRLGDVNNDGRQDLVAFTHSAGDVWVATSTGSSFSGTGWKWHDNFCTGSQLCEVGDVSGDGRADIVSFDRSNGHVSVALSTGSGFGAATQWHDWFCVSDEVCRLGDVNGDGRQDVIAFNRTSGDVWVATSTGTSFSGSGWKWHESFCLTGEECHVGDINADGRADVLLFTRGSTGDVWVALSSGSGFGGISKWHDSFCYGSEECRVGDTNADGRADIFAFTRGDAADVYTAVSTGSTFSGNAWLWHSLFCVGSETCLVGDVTGDNRADAVSFLK